MHRVRAGRAVFKARLWGGVGGQRAAPESARLGKALHRSPFALLILFDGGLQTKASAARRVLAPAALLATAGVVITAALAAAGARLAGLGWQQALLVGAIVSSTDAAAVFSVLRTGSERVQERVADLLEVESGSTTPWP